MAKTNLKKTAQGYGYQYVDMSSIHNYLESQGISYRQYIEPQDGVDYIWTIPVIDGEDQKPLRGCRIVEAKLSGKDNPVQAYGASLTYCRRYSLLMAFGLATTDDDAACLTVPAGEAEKEGLAEEIKKLAKAKGIQLLEICNRANVTAVEDMPVSQMKSCITWLNSEQR